MGIGVRSLCGRHASRDRRAGLLTSPSVIMLHIPRRHGVKWPRLHPRHADRVAIAGALAQRPAVLLLDELTTFLDGEDQGAVLAAVRALTRPDAGVTALWVRYPDTLIKQAGWYCSRCAPTMQFSIACHAIVPLWRMLLGLQP